MTLILIALNLAVFFIGHDLDVENRERAMEFYWASSLPAIELPRYVRTIQQRNSHYKFEKIMLICRKAEHSPGERQLLERLYTNMNHDHPFIDDLRAGIVIIPGEDIFPTWRQSRTAFDRLLANTTADNHGFIPASASANPLTAITYMFIHDGFGHLAGNILFLFLIGWAIEKSLGLIAYLFCYLAAGVGAAGAFWLAAPDGLAPLIGASGAVAGLMGLYAGIFGGRKLRLFYNVLFYFDYIQAPALMLLPLWFIGEYYQLHGSPNGHIAYISHIAGLSIGAMAAGSIYLLFPSRLNLAYLDEAD